MSTLREIESAADTLSRPQQELLLEHLAAKLHSMPLLPAKRETAHPKIVTWPDYKARMRAIYGDTVMPSMVLAEREQAVW